MTTRQQRLCAASVEGHNWPHYDAAGYGYGKCSKCGLTVHPPGGPSTGERDRLSA